MHRLALLLPLLIAACQMAGPGVGSISAPPQPGERTTTYNNDWVNPQPSALNSVPQFEKWSTDLSERELGQSPWFDNDGNPTGPRKPGWQIRQEERQAARKAEMRKRMGITNIRDEQRARNEAAGK